MLLLTNQARKPVGHHGGEEFSERDPNFLSYVQKF